MLPNPVPVRFMSCLPFTLIQECPYPNDWSNPENFSNDAHDPGGATMCGIIQTEYDAYRKANKLATQSVKLITQTEGYDIYYNSYWLPYCPILTAGLDLQFFDTSVNEGDGEAIKILQYALGISNDGIWGQQTSATVKAITNPVSVIEAFTARRLVVYREMSGFQYFGTDWTRRDSEIGAAALKMAA